uniref:Putative salivary lipocalin n=1 Tax=Panstrongylus lignarius TaxID=156445 RepID=A0A224XY43_9HEMI
MKLIIAVTFFGILTCAFAAYIPYKIKNCLDVTPMPNFQPKQFFTGTWYVTRAKNGTLATVCHKYLTKTERNGSLSFDYGYYENGNGDTFIQVHCEETGRTGNRKFSFNCKVVEGQDRSGFPGYNVDLTFIATDYNNYAIFYRCVPFLDGFADNFLILHRNKEDENSQVEPILLKQNPKLLIDDFFYRGESNCKENREF